MSFARQLKSATGQVTDALNQTWKRSVVQAFTQVITSTPKRDGFAQGSWVVGSNNDGQLPSRTAPDFGFNQRIPDIGGTVLLYSNLPYIERLENGWSDQAENGMVKIVVNQWPAILRSNTV